MNRFADSHVHMSSFDDFNAPAPFFRQMQNNGVTDVTVHALTYRAIIYNLMLLYWKNIYKDMTVSVFGMPNFYDEYYKDIPYDIQAKTLLDMGCDGIKLMFAGDTRKRIGYGIDDARLDKMFDYLEKKGTPITVHTPDADEFWDPSKATPYNIAHGRVYDHTYPSKQQLYDEALARLDKNPGLKITFAHFFFAHYDYNFAVRIMEKYPNVNFDLTPGSKIYVKFSENPPLWHDFVEKYADRILYGTDAGPWKGEENDKLYKTVTTALTHDYTDVHVPSHGGLTIKGINLSESALNKIMFENHNKIIGTPKKVDMEKVIECAKRVYKDITEKPLKSELMYGDKDGSDSKKWLEEFFKKVEN